MVSDIVLYDTDEVPVGDDQRQHVELARDIAIRFNHHFGDTFVVPEGDVPGGRRARHGPAAPTKKMSKSDDSPQGSVLVLDEPKAIAKKIKSAVTDSGTEVRHDRDEKPGVSNLIEIYGAVTGRTIAEVEREFDRQAVRRVQGARSPTPSSSSCARCRSATHELIADPAEVDRRLARGRGRRRRDRRAGAGARDAGDRTARHASRCVVSASRVRVGEVRRDSRACRRRCRGRAVDATAGSPTPPPTAPWSTTACALHHVDVDADADPAVAS